MIIQKAFYKGEGKLFDKLIRWGDKYLLGGEGIYSHVEIHFGNNLFFSADAWEGKVRFKTFIPTPGNWDFEDVEVTEVEYEEMMSEAKKHEGKLYSYRGVIRFVARFIPATVKYLFCSQATTIVCQIIGHYAGKKPEDMTPGMMRMNSN